jgi:hypothetical protein
MGDKETRRQGDKGSYFIFTFPIFLTFPILLTSLTRTPKRLSA